MEGLVQLRLVQLKRRLPFIGQRNTSVSRDTRGVVHGWFEPTSTVYCLHPREVVRYLDGPAVAIMIMTAP